VLDRELEQAGITGVLAVDYTRRQGGHWVLRASYFGEGRKGSAGAGKAQVCLYAVPSAERKGTEQAILAQALPALVSWLVILERSGNTRRGVDQSFHAEYRDGALSIHAT
jgi:hypothetical protein